MSTAEERWKHSLDRCRQKRQYSCERSAKDDAKRLHRARGMPGRRMKPYLCPHGGHWHLTSQGG